MAEDFVRPDGLTERRAKWRDLGVGMTILGNGRKWKIVESAIPEQFQYGYSLWFRMQAPQGETVNYPPQPLNRNAIILLDPDGESGLTPTLPDGHAEQALLVEQLGATEIATKDNTTGEVWCPNYAAGHHATDDWQFGREEYLHLRLAHGIDTAGLEAIEDVTEKVRAKATVHGNLHDGKMKSVGGFAHRHVPEDLSTT